MHTVAPDLPYIVVVLISLLILAAAGFLGQRG